MTGIRNALCAMVCLVFSLHLSAADSSSISTKISGAGFLVEGQIYKGYSNKNGGTFQHAWIQQATGLLKLESTFYQKAKIFIEGEGDVQFSYYIPMASWDKAFIEDQKVTKFNFWLKRAEGVYTFGDPASERFLLQIGAGLFEYKYNSDVRNLGEYLLRGSAYPVYFVNWFDGPYYRMAGLRMTTNPVDWFKFDALLFSELYQLPQQDFSLAGIATFKIGNMAEIGAGIDFNRLFSVDEKYTTVSGGARMEDNVYSRDSIGVDSITGGPLWANSQYYTFRSIKIALRASFDPKAFFPHRILGSEDLKLYAEYAILGLQNYPARNVSHQDYYSDISQRSPVMVGFNVPAFRVLDVLAVEFEELKSPYWAGQSGPFEKGLPIPPEQSSINLADVKWSVYAKRRIGAFTLIGQIARDHLIPNQNNAGLADRNDAMPESDDWWWALKVQYGF
jgi:hypothetical protein